VEVVSDSVKDAVTEPDENCLPPAIQHRLKFRSVNFRISILRKRYAERKHSLELRYAVPVDADLVLKDDEGWYPQLRLHYFLTVGREFLKMRDGQRVQTQKEKGSGAVWTPDLNKGQMSASVAAFQNLGILELLNPARSSEPRMKICSKWRRW